MKYKLAVFTMAFVTAFTTVCSSAETIGINIEGKTIEPAMSPQIIEGRTMLPVRDIFEYLGAEVTWDANTKTVTGKKNNTTVIMQLGSNTVIINGAEQTMDSSPVIVDGRTLAPARYVAQSFGYNVDWDGENKVVYISSDEENETKEEITEATTEETTGQVTTEEKTETTTAVQEEWINYFMSRDDKPEPVDESEFDDTLYPMDTVKEYHNITIKKFEDEILSSNLWGSSVYYDVAFGNNKNVEEKINDLWESVVSSSINDFEETYEGFKIEVEPAGNTPRISKDAPYELRKEQYNSPEARTYRAEVEAARENNILNFENIFNLDLEDVFGYSYTNYGRNSAVFLFSFADEDREVFSPYIAVFLNKDGDEEYYQLTKAEDGTYILKKYSYPYTKLKEETVEEGLSNDKLMFLEKINEIVKNSGTFN